MKERPILFNGPMVLAILDGRKTVTRRVVKPQPDFVANGVPARFTPDDMRLGRLGEAMRSPYGRPGDRLWVRESWLVQRSEPCLEHERDWQELISPTIRYLADGATHRIQGNRSTGAGVYRGPVEKGRPSIHMPRWASRITLEITGVRVERLREIDSTDAMAEGIANLSTSEHIDYVIPSVAVAQHPVRAFQLLWESINGAGNWDANPWVWVVEFKRVTP